MSRRSLITWPVALAGATLLQAATRRPNVVFVLATRWRADAVPWADDRDLAAPNLARLGTQSLTFSRAYACGSLSGESQECVRTGFYPHMLTKDSPGLREFLQQAGYRTASFGSRETGDLVGFVHAAGEPFFAEWLLDSGTDFLERVRPDAIRVKDNVPTFRQPRARADLAAFYARAKARDRDLGVLLAALDRPTANGNLQDNTLVVFISDRGEPYGAHGTDHPDEAWEESIRIPLAMKLPGTIRPSTSDLLISQVDIVPTVLSLCSVARPEGLPGRDFSPHLRGATFERPEAIYAEGRLGEKDEWRVLVRGYEKLITDPSSNVKALFRLAEDPLEMNNLAEVSSAQLTRDSLLASQKIIMRQLGDGVDASGLRKR